MDDPVQRGGRETAAVGNSTKKKEKNNFSFFPETKTAALIEKFGIFKMRCLRGIIFLGVGQRLNGE